MRSILNPMKEKPIIFQTLLLLLLLSGAVIGMAQDPCDTSDLRVSLTQKKLACSNPESTNGKAAQILATPQGGVEPYTYQWWYKRSSFGNWIELNEWYTPSDPALAMGLTAYTWYAVDITDAMGCVVRDSLFTAAYPTPDIEISCEPGDTVYLQNPSVTFSFENQSQDILIDHFFWTFEQGMTSTQQEPVFTYVESKNEPYEALLTVYDDCGCDTTYTKNVYVLPVKLKIPSVFTPNGDGQNDTFVITLDDGNSSGGGNSGTVTRDAGADEKPLNVYYQSTDLVIMNRWGRIVYHSTNYQNDWDGGGLSDGTYFYILKCKGLKEVVQYQGAVMILTKQK